MKMKIYSMVLLVLLLASHACNNKLDIEPTSSIDAGKGTQDVELVLLGAYAIMGSGVSQGFTDDIDGLYGANLIVIPDLLAADNYLTWTGSFTQYRNIVERNMVNTNNAAAETWRRAYACVNSANLVLANLSKADGDERTQFEAEARFIRGIIFFELVRLYAQQWVPGAANNQPGIPLPLQPTVTISGDVSIPRSTVAQVYTQVLEDLNFAKENLPEENGFRASTFTASGFLARVFLQRSEFSQALEEADRVITEGPYELAGSVEEIYNTGASPSTESIFETQQTDQNNAGQNNGALYGFYGCGGSPAGNGRGDINPDSTFYNQYEELDERRTELFYEGSCTKSGKLTTGKWKDPYSNYLVMRLTEMYLIRAECNFRLGTTTGGTPLEDVNLIRTRANATPLPTISLASILQERKLELAFEGFGIHDIRRTQGTIGSVAWNNPKLVLPIPLRELNVNTALEQNTGY
ncbi:RagB/SusD family nutrient uptake outer membrane protein [Rhodocytophaga rosea]|uniref:RagB/SusD family nutrient uptake outer membrane protein n=1 Tax=Rhodocytophaga rosea TaxID=2704465 RepID=A0A6C0GC52_9BACT|nr:RagB/SusD family nutrient uptake outer membrane protein [Rhodocytophaga rosea]QHT65525.1 RagB/SusD family nutrient uptake outer membrane protein [Rhodocytophaga rosea]